MIEGQSAPRPKPSLSALLQRPTRRALPPQFAAPGTMDVSPAAAPLPTEHADLMKVVEARLERMNVQLLGWQDLMMTTLSTRVEEIVTREGRAVAAERALREAIEGSRNDERSRMLSMQIERQDTMIADLQRELEGAYRLLRGEVGSAQSRYFTAVGDYLQDASNELQEHAQRLEEVASSGRYEPHLLKSVGERVANLSLDLEEFGQNAALYGEEAQASD